MPNLSTPKGANHSGWFRDDVNNRLEFFYDGTKIGHLDANGFSITNDTTARMANGLLAVEGIDSELKQQNVQLGTVGAVASNGAGALITGQVFVAPAACKIVSAWRMNHSASDVTKGTATTSASYRRMTLVANTAAAGTGTHIVASLNATASAASWDTRPFTVAASTIPAGGVVRISHLTVGADTADGTDMAANTVAVAFELV